MAKILYEVGDVVFVNLNPTVKDEKGKTRPCLIIESGCTPLKLVIVIPITEDKGRRAYKIFAPIRDIKTAGLTKKSVVDCYQIRTISTERIVKKVGQVGEDVLYEVRYRLAKILDIGEEHTY